MVQVKIKRVYEPEENADGYRVLVDKLWPRGIRKENLHYDLWAKDITPSTPLRQWYHQNEEGHWEEFREKYIKELENSSAVKDFIDKLRDQKIVTLLYASKNAAENHALVLQKFIEGKL
ncbi:MAG: DUF488 family protein [Dysgonamonadaceae bacterium]|jgi:uncharacterized protein YeaO (DUF488 family)|nr:DUF488 family protein [Dysgonamonadaceae bacterium]